MMTAAETIRVLIADDHQMFRQMLIRTLRFDERIQMIGEASDGVQAVQMAKKLRPDVVLMDITMPGLTGIEATRAIRQESPDVRVIGLSMHNDPAVRDEMLKAGASGYVSKDAVLEELLRVLLPE